MPRQGLCYIGDLGSLQWVLSHVDVKPQYRVIGDFFHDTL